MKISAKVRAEAIEALLQVATQRQHGGWSLITDWCNGDAWSIAYDAWRTVSAASSSEWADRNSAHSYAAAASLLDAGWSP